MSTLNVSNISDGTDTVETGYVVNGSAKAWVNFNGAGTIATRTSLNVSGLTDNGTGDYSVSLTTAFDEEPSFVATGGSAGRPYSGTGNKSSIRIYHTGISTDTVIDTSVITMQACGDLA
jgi:hypothetical protein